jgi:hypothetical protein
MEDCACLRGFASEKYVNQFLRHPEAPHKCNDAAYLSTLFLLVFHSMIAAALARAPITALIGCTTGAT